ncbi:MULTISPECIES: GNAT family N-acetyltransferase [unclassified Bacillus (in: firmicutes)]|uniref:GNAT family N-acetyltransferase n=1 Tax=unclassified Bacillus (in: firmicutes) TaxID=185979 RepID=UPI0008E14EC8|nr:MULTISPECIES: GNAT family N-acetyltransferase [unclassified Bacillus (in: firmicutes)]SFK02323.1 Acetyltransferase (GNAT) family protein [Bacillus sp. 71mf]SFS52379.1 Acetyltransferase (GNAT) family protein [Bacillus sp. 103mf]
MGVTLEKAAVSDAELIYAMQVETFLPLLETYQDYNTNPANEKFDRVITRIHNPYGGFYKIMYNKAVVGAVCVVWKEGTTKFWISPMFILPKYQGKGIAQKVILLLEEMFPQATSWELATILEEKRNCYLYEKMGFVQTGVSKRLNDCTTLVYYQKPLQLMK